MESILVIQIVNTLLEYLLIFFHVENTEITEYIQIENMLNFEVSGKMLYSAMEVSASKIVEYSLPN